MSAMASQITMQPHDRLLNHFSGSASLAFARGILRRPVNSPHKRPVTQQMFPFDDVIMQNTHTREWNGHENIRDNHEKQIAHALSFHAGIGCDLFWVELLPEPILTYC